MPAGVSGIPMRRLGALLRKALALGPNQIAARLVGRARGRVWSARERQRDVAEGTYSRPTPSLPWRGRIAIAAADIADEWHEPLRLLGDQALRHCFDLLGSGPVQPRYGMRCDGFLGRVFAPSSVITDTAGAWLAGQVNASNLTRARALWRRIGNPVYSAIDWQIDFRSGHRWRSDRHVTELAIPVDTGADVKVPWELGRLQHFPVLALCAVLASSGATGLAEAEVYVCELRDQLFDFIALNPPRFGVQWMCPMDVAIRIANIVFAFDLLAGAGIDPGREAFDVVIATARDHAGHIASHLEWTETHRGNHYLANLVGLLWASAYLPPDPDSDASLAFAVAEFLDEAPRHFTEDGGNYEGSSNYHRLAGELLLYGAALLAGLGPEEHERIAQADPARLHTLVPKLGRAPKRDAMGKGDTVLPADLRGKLWRAGQLAKALTRPDGGTIQIGDTDSGHLFTLTPVGRIIERTFVQNTLDARPFIGGVEALFGGSAVPATIDAVIVARLANGARFAKPPISQVYDHGDLDGVIDVIAGLPSSRRRHVAADVPLAAWQRTAFAQFGLYSFRAGSNVIAFRCAPEPSPAAPLGHTHDDNLGIEYVLGDEKRIDPGLYCYTPSLAERDRYRDAAAHDVVRADGWQVGRPEGMFDHWHAGWARCLAWQPNGVAGEIRIGKRRLMRALKLTQAGLDIWDGVAPPDRLRPVAAPPPIASGYGQRELPRGRGLV